MTRDECNDLTKMVPELAALHLIINHPGLHGRERAPKTVSHEEDKLMSEWVGE